MLRWLMSVLCDHETEVIASTVQYECIYLRALKHRFDERGIQLYLHITAFLEEFPNPPLLCQLNSRSTRINAASFHGPKVGLFNSSVRVNKPPFASDRTDLAGIQNDVLGREI